MKAIDRINDIRLIEYMSQCMDGVELEADLGTDEWDAEAAATMDTYCRKLHAGLFRRWPGAAISVSWQADGGSRCSCQAYTSDHDDGDLMIHDAEFASIISEVQELAWAAVW
jgi:hypothetical protein